MTTLLNLAETATGITTLGPGRRIVLWTQGCLADCPGCISPDWRPLRPAQLVNVSNLTKWILHSKQDHAGLTISGGEPMLQARGLLALWQSLLKELPDWTLILYSGYTRNQINHQNFEIRVKLLEGCDAFIGGQYKKELNDKVGLRGSSNQDIYLPITSRFTNDDLYSLQTSERKQQVFISGNTIHLAGIPCLPPEKHRGADGSETSEAAGTRKQGTEARQ